MTATATDKRLQDRLKAIREEAQRKRADLAAARAERDAARDAFSKKEDLQDNSKIHELPEFRQAQEAVEKMGRIDDEINALSEAEKGILTMLGGNPAPGAPSRDGHVVDAPSAGWNGQTLLAQSEEYREALERGTFTSDQRFGTVFLGEVCTREEFSDKFLGRPMGALPTAPAGQVGTDQGAIAPDVRGIIPPYVMPLTLLDLFPTGTTDSNIIQYVQVTAVPGSAAETAELAVKPQEGITLADATAPVRTIAGWIKLARQAMDDIPALAAMINQLLPWDVRRRLMVQMLAGTGVGQNLLGILNVSGIGAPASAAGDNVADGILRALTTIVLSDADPNFVAMNPLTGQNLMMLKATNTGTGAGTAGSFEYVYGAPGAVGPQSIWGLRIVQNRAIAQANPLVGDSMGAMLLVREGVNIKTSDSDQDDFINNRVTVLAECRVAFPIWRPVAYAKAPLG